MITDELPRDLPSFLARFGTDAQCRSHLFAQRWPAGFCCAGFGHGVAYHHRRRLIEECAACGRQHSLLAGTIFEQTKTGLARWFLAIWLVTSSKGGISAMELQRQMGFGSYQTAWSWLHKIRKAMVAPGRGPLAAPGRGRRDAAGWRAVGQARPRRRRQDGGRRCGRGGTRPGPQAPARPAAARGRRRRLGRKPGGLPRRQRGPARRGDHRRLAGLCRAGRGRLRPRRDQSQHVLGRCRAPPAGHPPRLRPGQTLGFSAPITVRSARSICRPTSTSTSSVSIAAPPKASATASLAWSSRPSSPHPPATAPSSAKLVPPERRGELDIMISNSGNPSHVFLRRI